MSEQFNPEDLVAEMKVANKALEDQKKAFAELEKSVDERIAEKAKGAVDPILDERIGKINDVITKSQERLDKFELAMKRTPVKYVDKDGNEIDMDAKSLDWARMCGKRRGTDVTEYTAKDLGEYKAAFLKWMRKDDRGLNADEQKSLSVGTDSDGGYVVYPDMSGRIVQKVFESTPMRQYASVQVIGTDALEGLFDLDEASASWVEETATRSETDTSEIGRWRIPVHEQAAFPHATQKLLDDASMDMEVWLAAKMADKFARAEATAFVTGDGVGKPRGFATYASGTTLPGTIEQKATGVSGDFAAAPNGFDTLINALYALKAPYRANAVWAMNRTTAAALRKEKDSDGRMIWEPAGAAGQPPTVLGHAVASFEDMADIAANSLSIAVGDWRAAYQIVDRMGIRVLRDPYSNKPYVGFYATRRVGGDVVNFEAIKLIKFGS